MGDPRWRGASREGGGCREGAGGERALPDRQKVTRAMSAAHGKFQILGTFCKFEDEITYNHNFGVLN